MRDFRETRIISVTFPNVGDSTLSLFRRTYARAYRKTDPEVRLTAREQQLKSSGAQAGAPSALRLGNRL